MLTFLYSLVFIYLVGFSFCYSKVRQLQAEGYDEMTFKDCFNPLKWISVAMGFILKYLVEPHVLEQMVIRLYDESCKPCYRDGVCHVCGCNSIAKAYSPIESCSADNWGPIIFNKQKYEKLREEFPVEIKITYGTEDSK